MTKDSGVSVKFRVWYYEEFKDFSEDEREDRAWKVADQRCLLYPENSVRCDDVREAAELYADYFHSQRDGWENTWPVEFVVHDGENYFVVEVERETVPEFHARKPRPCLDPPQPTDRLDRFAVSVASRTLPTKET